MFDSSKDYVVPPDASNLSSYLDAMEQAEIALAEERFQSRVSDLALRILKILLTKGPQSESEIYAEILAAAISPDAIELALRRLVDHALVQHDADAFAVLTAAHAAPAVRFEELGARGIEQRTHEVEGTQYDTTRPAAVTQIETV